MLISVFDKLPEEQSTPSYLGGKGYGLWWMQQQGVNVPPALIIPTSVCVDYMKAPKTTVAKVKAQIKQIKQFFIDRMGYVPLLSVRSGARVSMPGMMDTILNVGLDSKTFNHWQQKIGPDCAFDSYKRLVVMYGNVVKGVERKELERETFPETMDVYKRKTGEDFPEHDEQLLNSIEAVFRSWNNERAKTYRKLHNIPNDWGTAVIIQAMVFGNLDDQSGTGVLFTRNPDSGENEVVGEFLINAQGEDVVAGTRTPMPLKNMKDWSPVLSDELLDTVNKLEELKREVQDVEFTIQSGKLYILQTRTAKRSARAAVKIALDMLEEKLISVEEARKRVSARELDLADLPVIDAKGLTVEPLASGIPACSGVAVGVPVFSSEEAIEKASKGQKVILVTHETTPDDIKGMVASVGVLTMTGGSTSHAAVVARSMNKVCVVGLGDQYMDKIKSAVALSLDGASGRVWTTEVPVVGGQSKEVEQFRQLVIGAGSLLVDQPPAYKVERLTLDLIPSLLCTGEHLKTLITRCLYKCQTLEIMIGAPTSEQLSVLSVFLPATEIQQRVADLRKFVDTLDLPKDRVTVIGWESPAFKAVPCVSANDLEALVLTKTSGLLIGGPDFSKPKAYSAYAKVLGWLYSEGVSLKALNQPGGVASWTVHANA